MNKSGVSAVVATVLIVMITVAAVGLLWAIVAPFLKSNIADKTACVDAEMSISVDSGSKYTCVSENNGTAVRVGRGNDDNEWRAVQIVYTDSGGNSEKISYAYPPEKNSEKVYRNVNMTDVARISVLPILEGRGDDLVCSKTIELPSVKDCSGEVEASMIETSMEYYEEMLYCDGGDVSYQDKVCLNNVIGYFPFDFDFNDYSGHDYTVTKYDHAKIENGALVLDGAGDYVNVGNAHIGESNFTISFWGNVLDWTQVANKALIFEQGNDIILELYTDQILLTLNNQFSYPVGVDAGLADDAFLGGFFHYSVVYDYLAKTGYFYIDGEYIGSGTTSITYTPFVAFSWGIGKRDSYYLNGALDEFIIFDRALAADEIKNIFDAGR